MKHGRDFTIFILLLSTSIIIISSIPETFADHMTAEVSNPPGSGSTDACAATNECFIPYEVTIDVGGEVTWTNDDTLPHTVTSGDLSVDPDNLGTVFDSSLLMAGNVFSHQFDVPGTYPYFCMVHPWMVGQVIVSGGTPTTPLRISVNTDKSSYRDGDVIQIFGQVSEVLPRKPVSVRVIAPDGNIVTIEQVEAGADKTFSVAINAGGYLWQSSGTYTIETSYGETAQNTATAITTFEFSAASGSRPSTTIGVEGTDFLLSYTITGGRVLSITPDVAANSLIIAIDSTSNGQLTITLPRMLIDALLPSGNDDLFFVLVDGKERYYDETKTDLERTLTVNFERGTEEIEIIGTFLAGSDLPFTPSITPIIPRLPTSSPVSTTQIIIPEGTGTPGCEPNNCYSPAVSSVKVGSTITWTNMDNVVHTVTSGNLNTDPDSIGNLFDSSLISSKRGFSHTFTRAGTFDYFCMVHPWMTGQVIVGSGGIFTPTPSPSGSSLSVMTNRESYRAGNSVDVSVKLSGVGSGQNIGIAITDPNGSNIVSRTITTDSSGTGALQFKLSENSVSGSYKIIATTSVAGQSIQDTASFNVQSLAGNVSIRSIQPTDQNGNSVSSFNKGKMGFVKVVLSSDSGISSLVTVNLFDSDQTSLGVGSFKTTLGLGQSEMIISFFIPNDANSGTSDIYANVFSDWPSRGGTPLTGEAVARVTIR
ncbi:MAG: plastocyanin/azurin family copper-binding protein [Nitrosopumilaceae archaeon]